MTDSAWWVLSAEDYARLNPPEDAGDLGEWLPVGYIPRPQTRLGWFLYHLMHGLWMRYPLVSVLGYALTNTKPSNKAIDLTEGYRDDD